MGAILSLMGIGSGVSWIVYAVVFGLGLAAGAAPSIWIEQERISGYEQTAKAALDTVKERDRELVIVNADVSRWHKASDDRDVALNSISTLVAHQNAKIESARANDANRDAAVAIAEAQTRDARAAFEARVQEIEAEAKTRPMDVVPLGAITVKRAPHLFDKDTPPGV